MSVVLFKLRPLKISDYDCGVCELLSQLSDMGKVDQKMFETRFQQIKEKNCYHILVIEDVASEKIAAVGTLFIEDKFLHSCSRVGHVEDVVVSKEYRGQQLGVVLMTALKKIAEENNCYKVILDCSNQNIPFYKNLGYTEHQNHMAMYFKSKSVEQSTTTTTTTKSGFVKSKL
jgi:glucosamine-phosphate N-acetyltransferase